MPVGTTDSDFVAAYAQYGDLQAELGVPQAEPAPPHRFPAVVGDGRGPTTGAHGAAPAQYVWHDGEKFPGGFGPTTIAIPDYWTLRARSVEAFERNLYARGLIRRLVDNVINTGLHLEATPSEGLLGYPEDGLADWTEDVETRFELWGKDPALCDHKEEQTFGALGASVYRDALISGDMLVMAPQSRRTKLPRVRVISGSAVRTPYPMPKKLRKGNEIKHGVELDPQGRHVAYWVRKQAAGERRYTFDRIPAYGPKTGRRTAWLVYGTDKRLDSVRGLPILSLMLQSLKELDRFRDATLRKVVMQSFLTLFISKGEDKPGTMPMSGGALRKDALTSKDADGGDRTWNSTQHVPGLMLEELQHGEEPKAFPTAAANEDYGKFETAIVRVFAWANNIPPEILELSFSSNYSASQAALNEFKLFLNVARAIIGSTFCQPIYREWLISQVLNGAVDAPGLLDSWRGGGDPFVLSAWVDSDWTGAIKATARPLETVKAYAAMVEMGAMSRDRMSRELTGTKYSQNVKKLRRENAQLAEANESLTPAAAADPSANVDPDEEDAKEDAQAAGAVVHIGPAAR